MHTVQKCTSVKSLLQPKSYFNLFYKKNKLLFRIMKKVKLQSKVRYVPKSRMISTPYSTVFIVISLILYEIILSSKCISEGSTSIIIFPKPPKSVRCKYFWTNNLTYILTQKCVRYSPLMWRIKNRFALNPKWAKPNIEN